MAYDLLIKNGLVVDGSGMPAFRGDVGVKGGRIAEIGKLSGGAARTIDAAGRAVAPGFIDNHCHYDAQVTWDPLCTFSPEHGATSVIFGNCSLSLAPVRKGTEERLAEFLSYVEAIPMEILKTVEFEWETVPQYMEHLDHHLGVNIGNLIGHTAVRHYVMGDDCQKPGATEAQIKAMQEVVRDGMQAGALGLSVSREKGHFDPQGVLIPALWADETEIFALADVLRDMGTGTIQAGGGQYVELKDGMMRRLAESSGRTVVYNSLSQTMRRPDEWKIHMARIEETAAMGIRAYPMCSPNRGTQDFTMKNTQVFRGLPTWHPILLMLDEEKLRLYADPEVRPNLLGGWVREQQVMSLEQAVRRLTFDSASTFSLYHRGLLRRGMAADIAIFDPATVKCGKEEVVHDSPAGGWRIKETSEGVTHTIVNGQVLLEDKKHTGALPGRVLRNSYWHAHH